MKLGPATFDTVKVGFRYQIRVASCADAAAVQAPSWQRTAGTVRELAVTKRLSWVNIEPPRLI
jgi:hypothetical protein